MKLDIKLILVEFENEKWNKTSTTRASTCKANQYLIWILQYLKWNYKVTKSSIKKQYTKLYVLLQKKTVINYLERVESQAPLAYLCFSSSFSWFSFPSYFSPAPSQTGLPNHPKHQTHFYQNRPREHVWKFLFYKINLWWDNSLVVIGGRLRLWRGDALLQVVDVRAQPQLVHRPLCLLRFLLSWTIRFFFT